MEGSSIGAGLSQGISRTAQQRYKSDKVAVIPARVMKEYRGMEMRLHSFLISTPDGEIEVLETEGGDPPLCRRQLFWLYLWKPSPCVVGIANRYGLDGPGIESRWG
jgi:membrane protein involved in colicin uptake